MTFKVILSTAGLVSLLFHKAECQNKKQIYYEDTQSGQYRQEYTPLQQDPSPFPPHEPKLPPELAAPQNYIQDPIHTSGGALYEPSYAKEFHSAPYQPPAAPAYPAQSYPPPAAPYQPPAAYPAQSYSPPSAPYQPPAAPYAPPAPPPLPSYVVTTAPQIYPVPEQAYGENYHVSGPTGYDSYSLNYESPSYGGYDDSYGKGYGKHKSKGYADVLGMKKYYLLKIFGSLVKAKGGILVGIGKLLKWKGKLLLAKGEALEEIGYYLKEIKQQYESYGYGYDDNYHKGKGHKSKGYGYDDHKGKIKLKHPKKPKKGYGIPHGDPYQSEGYLDYRRKGKLDFPVKDSAMSGSLAVVAAEQKDNYVSSQGPPIPLQKTEPIKRPEPPKPPATNGKPIPVNSQERLKGDQASLDLPVKTTPKPKYSNRVTKPVAKLRTTKKPDVTPKVESGFQPMFDYDSNELVTEPPTRDGWAPVKFY